MFNSIDLILVLFLMQFSTNKVYAKFYKIKNIEIVEPYEVSFNKLHAIDKAFISAFHELTLKITSAEDIPANFFK